MSILTPEIVYRKWATAGVPDSGAWQPKKDEIIQLLNMLFGISRGGWVVARTRAELLAIVPEEETDGGVVLNDPNPAYNGYYQRDAGAWTRERGFPDTLARLLVTGGTGNAVQASIAPGVDPSTVLAFFVDITTANTGNVTVSINGAAAVPALNVNGDQFAAGEWSGRLFLSNEGTSLRALNDAAASASAAQSAAAADLSRIAAEAAASSATGGGFPSMAIAEAYSPVSAPDFMRLEGYYYAGDGGGALYKKVGAEPTHDGKFSITLDGGGGDIWFEYVPGEHGINVLCFGADPTGTVDSSAQCLSALSLLETESHFRGGCLFFPKGFFKLNATLPITWYESGTALNINLKGDGPQTTLLDFSGAPAGSDGVHVGPGVHFGISDLTIFGAPRDGLAVVGSPMDGDDFASFGSASNMRLQSNGRFGFHSTNSFMLALDDIWSRNNGAGGFNFGGFHTSLSVNRCEASGHETGFGWSINACIYSVFNACGCDNNLHGYVLSNCRGVVFNGCGAETIERDAWKVWTSNALSVNVLAAVQDIRGVQLNGCYVLHGSHETPGGFAGFMSLSTQNARSIEISLNNCVSVRNDVADRSVVADGTSGTIFISEERCSFDAPVLVANSVRWEGREFAFTPTIKGSVSAGVGTYTTQSGRYILRDGKVHVEANIAWTAHTGSGNMSIAGLPFPAKAGQAVPVLLWVSNLTYSGAIAAYISGSDISLLGMVSATPLGQQTLDSAASVGLAADYVVG